MFERYKIPYLSTDHLMMAFMNGVQEMEIHDKLWPNEIAEKMWRFLKPFIESIIVSKEDYIIEGEAMLPTLIMELIEQYPNQIKACFVGYSTIEIDDKIEYIKNHSSDIDWLTPLGDEEIKKHVSNMIEYSKFIKNQAEECGINYIDTSVDFSNFIEKCISTIYKQ